MLVDPFESRMMQGLEIFNEVCTLALTYVLICLTDANQAVAYTVNYYDYAFMFGMATNLAVHVFLLIKESALSIKDSIKAKLCKPKAKPVSVKGESYAVEVSAITQIQGGQKRLKIEEGGSALKL